MWADEVSDWWEGGVRGDRVPHAYTEGEWPYEAVPLDDAPLPVHYGLALARTLDMLCERHEISHRALSLRAGLAPNGVGRIVRGEVYPDLATVARLEAAVDAPIYPQGLYRDLPGTNRPENPQTPR
ncbi:helix-turn-helix domain-containing protein [Streptomyces sp. NPDC057654]|uniref:helix-turn-helix domain-containing protein n=1 Tax=Streptomyces sp. NPDC057654 TaxID=3346196 RepID=UPI0036CFDADC